MRKNIKIEIRKNTLVFIEFKSRFKQLEQASHVIFYIAKIRDRKSGSAGMPRPKLTGTVLFFK